MEALPILVWLLFILLQICQDIVQNSPQVFYELSLEETSPVSIEDGGVKDHHLFNPCPQFSVDSFIICLLLMEFAVSIRTM